MVLVSNQNALVNLHFCSHFSTQRRASFAHMEAVLRNFVPLYLNVTLLIVAVVDSTNHEMEKVFLL